MTRLMYETAKKTQDELRRTKRQLELPVYVVTFGDFPDSVWADKEKAEAYVEALKKKAQREAEGRRIHLRVYEYKVRR